MKLNIPKPAQFLFFMSILGAINFLVPWTTVLAKSGLLNPEVASNLAIYSDISFFLVFVVIIYFANLLWKKNDEYGDNIGVFNKEEGILKNFSYTQITFISFIVFSALFLIAQLSGNLGNGIFSFQIIPMQFSPTDILIVSTGQIPIAENMMLAFSIGLIALFLTFLAFKFNWDKNIFLTQKYLWVIIGSATLGAIWHSTVYSNSPIATTTVAIFWGLGGLISLGTGSFIPFLALHMVNNFFLDFSRLTSSQTTSGTAIGILLVLSVIYYYIYRKNGDWLKGADR